MLLIFLFMYIFSFLIFESPFLLTSGRLLYIIVIPFFLVNKRWIKYSINIIMKKKVFIIFCFLVVIIIFSVCVPIFHSTYDYSIIRLFISQYVSIAFGIIIYSLFKIRNKVEKLPLYLIYIFIIQSLIQLVSFFSPNIRELFNVFRYEKINRFANNNIRGLAISGSQFFGLGVGFGLVFIFYTYFWDDLFKRVKVLKYLSLIVLFFGALSAARSSLAGILIASFYLILKKVNKSNYKLKSKIKVNFTNLSLIILLIFILIFAIYTVNLNFIFDRIYAMSNFAFEFIYNYLEEGELRTDSTDVLFNRMYFKIPLKTFFIGDGLYTNSDGSYYMNTDAGYMRNILYFGIIGFLLLLIYQIQFFVWKKNKLILFNILIIIYILTMHIKGEVLAFNIIMQKMLFLLLLHNIHQEQKTGERRL